MPIHSKLISFLRGTNATGPLRGSSTVELAVAIVLAVAAVGAVFDPPLLGDDSAKAAAQVYVTGEARSNIGAVTAVADVRTDLVGSADASLLDDRSLRATLAKQVSPPTSVRVGEPTITGNRASVDVAYRAADATEHIKLTLDRVFPLLRLHGTWRVRVEPSFLRVQIPAAAGDLTVDGLAVHLPSGRPATVAVLPGEHVLSTTGGALIAGESVPYCPPTNACRWLGVDPAGSAQVQAVALQLTAAGSAAAAKAVTAAFATCSGQATAGPTACPQTFVGLGSPSISWTLVGDPTSDAQFGVDPASGAVQVFGNYQMIAAADYGGRVIHRPSSGAYTLRLQPAGATFTSGPIISTTLPNAIRPAAATDQAVLDAARAGLTKCAQAIVADPPDCPQSISANASNVSWSIQGDQLAGAAISFNPETDSFQVAGRVTLRVQYDSSLLGIALHNDSVSDYPYTARLLWDGHQAILVTILGLNQE